jgi:fumarate reductase subunit C
MNRFAPAAHTYRRSMSGWWRRNPYFTRYMIREGSAAFLTVYALILLDGLYRLGSGQGPFDAWRAALAAWPAVAWHCCALLLVGYHSLTWFQVLPKTAPQLRVSPRRMTAAALAAAAALSALLFASLWWASR